MSQSMPIAVDCKLGAVCRSIRRLRIVTAGQGLHGRGVLLMILVAGLHHLRLRGRLRVRELGGECAGAGVVVGVVVDVDVGVDVIVVVAIVYGRGVELVVAVVHLERHVGRRQQWRRQASSDDGRGRGSNGDSRSGRGRAYAGTHVRDGAGRSRRRRDSSGTVDELVLMLLLVMLLVVVVVLLLLLVVTIALLQLGKAQIAHVVRRQRVDAQGRSKVRAWADGRQADK